MLKLKIKKKVTTPTKMKDKIFFLSFISKIKKRRNVKKNNIKDIRSIVFENENPETILFEEYRLEPDYIFDII